MPDTGITKMDKTVSVLQELFAGEEMDAGRHCAEMQQGREEMMVVAERKEQ